MQIERPLPELSPREKELLQFAAEGLTDGAISHRLGISEATVRTYWGRVRIKLGPFSRTELVAIIMRAEREAAVESLRRENEALIEKLQAEAQNPLYRDLLDNAPDALILVTESGQIDHANTAALELFGYEQEELEGAELMQLLPLRYREVHVQHLRDYVQDASRRPMGEHLETPALHKDGREFPIRAALSATKTPAGTIFICAIRPVLTG